MRGLGSKWSLSEKNPRLNREHASRLFIMLSDVFHRKTLELS